MTTGLRATFVISWTQTEAEGCRPAMPEALTTGASWRWTGVALRVDAPRDVLLLEGALGMIEMRRSAARVIRRLIGMEAEQPRLPARPRAGPDDGEMPEQGFVLSDGVRCWTATILNNDNLAPGAGAARFRGQLLAFQGEMPPKDRDLWVVRSQPGAGRRIRAGGVICFTSGTAIRTPTGVVAVEWLRPGDLVLTRDNGPREVLWTGSRHMSGARLHAMPHLRPVRICESALGQGRPDGDLLVSPSHRILLRGPAARALFNTPEVLVRAGDMVDDHAIRTDLTLREVTYHHILLEQHEILFANGIEADSFHPGEADPAGLDPYDHENLLSLIPGLRDDPMEYGDFARRSLTLPETALLRHEYRI